MGPTGAINTKVRVNFSNERSRSTPLDPKLMFWCVPFLFGCIWNHFATARNLLHTKLKAKRAKLVQLIEKFVQQYLVRIFRNERS